jgi:integrase/recombinase XerD
VKKRLKFLFLTHITVRTIQRIFEDACNKAEIKKDIQELLGHKSSKTTEIYTHVSNRDLGKIKSPLDFILNPEVKENE